MTFKIIPPIYWSLHECYCTYYLEIPYELLPTKAIKRLQNIRKELLVFVSSFSPDGDITAAVSTLKSQQRPSVF